jgi:acetylornithine aminotransferase
MFDEVQVGLGRTGTLFAYQNYDVAPDVMTLAKALANGLPMGATLAREEVAQAFSPGTHASTFGGTPLVSAAALAVLEIMLAPGFLDQVVRTGAYFKSALTGLADRYDFIEGVRGLGLILGLKLAFPAQEVQAELLRRGFLTNCIQDYILRFLPPLIIGQAEVERLIPVLEETLVFEAARREEQR